MAALAALQAGDLARTVDLANQGPDDASAWVAMIRCGVALHRGDLEAAERFAAQVARDGRYPRCELMEMLLDSEPTRACARLLVLDEVWISGAEALSLLSRGVRDDLDNSNTNARGYYRMVIDGDDGTEVVRGIARYCLARKNILADPPGVWVLHRQLVNSTHDGVAALGRRFWDDFGWSLDNALRD